jgi:hypothetical protein
MPIGDNKVFGFVQRRSHLPCFPRSELSPPEPPAFVRISRTPAASVSLFRSVCDGNVHAVAAAPFEFMEDVDGKILSRNLTLPASDGTRWAPAGAHEIACLQMER